ncbi:MAG: hypothetical protein R2879_13065 [Saprospiraceae bacterium]
MRTTLQLFCMGFCLFLLTNSNTMAQNPDYEKKIDDLLAKMTLEEKVGQMNQYNGFWEITKFLIIIYKIGQFSIEKIVTSHVEPPSMAALQTRHEIRIFDYDKHN